MRTTLTAATVAFGMAATSLAAQTTLILGEAGPNRGARAEATQAFADDVAARTNGDVTIDIQWGGALFKADAALQGVS
ncbi:MAG: C4-dicarboxylate ABC transporter substrate-binding protein, partial [Alphaproteobacteria bacterium]|nr:C4-dicarboxylate ABC transporter substrate-binding protein [Alphaproteobacteria bacterium]